MSEQRKIKQKKKIPTFKVLSFNTPRKYVLYKRYMHFKVKKNRFSVRIIEDFPVSCYHRTWINISKIFVLFSLYSSDRHISYSQQLVAYLRNVLSFDSVIE